MAKNIHEIRDPIHVFVRLDSDERKILNSRPFQRLRHIHQLAMIYLVYPGATHKRFEHSLGVMELASRVFDIVTNPDNVTDKMQQLLEPLASPDQRAYWRRVVRMAALCHDIGHLPFSHAAEKELLPDGWDHERLTQKIIFSGEMQKIWHSVTPPLRHEDIENLAVGPKTIKSSEFTDWEAILAEIIVGDAFGVDRMDYLLRDSYHTGVAYGRFDYYRLIDTLRILPSAQPDGNVDSQEPALGMEEGGIQSAEALMLARYFIYSQVYFHPVRRIYDIHLMDFLKEWLPDGIFSTDLEEHLKMTDSEITAALWEAAFDESKAEHLHASRIVCRKHFKRIYERNPEDVQINLESGKRIFEALKSQFDEGHFRHDFYSHKSGAPDFPVRMRDDRIVSSLVVSDVLKNIPVVAVDYVFAERSCFENAHKWLNEHRQDIIKPESEEDNEQNEESRTFDAADRATRR